MHLCSHIFEQEFTRGWTYTKKQIFIDTHSVSFVDQSNLYLSLVAFSIRCFLDDFLRLLLCCFNDCCKKEQLNKLLKTFCQSAFHLADNYIVSKQTGIGIINFLGQKIHSNNNNCLYFICKIKIS